VSSFLDPERADLPRALTRRQFTTGAAALGAATLAGCATPAPAPAPAGPEPSHPLSGIASFDGALLEPPALVGKVTVVDFWASWCAPCRQGFKYLDQLYRTYQRDGLQVVGVSVDDDPVKGRAFRSRMRPRFDIAWDPSGAVRERFRIVGLPTTLLLDEQAKLVHRHEGFDVSLHRILETHVRRLVREG
jgi:thiol-disulfide isomerase/thioredoxin